ncbi:DUF4406 domain-containing protein [Pseudomonas glycinae]|uniref:DUF4406 domain-containing protein n=1 Tax=Pseudomonas glycinae TaxID=1785145 RepID=UPI002B1E3689|nr:DUF4406 domain-containing protein [Pseudomonas glycinae]
MKRIYLSGPMTGLPGLNFPAFHAMTTSLRDAGHVVTNPAELNPDGGSWNDCMRRDIAALMGCDTVATLPGWEHSKGARLEVLIADRLGMPVVNAHDLVAMEIAG